MQQAIADLLGLRLPYIFYWCEMYNGAIFEVCSLMSLTKAQARMLLLRKANAEGDLDIYHTEDIMGQGKRKTPKPRD